MIHWYEELLREWLAYLSFSEASINKGVGWICLLSLVIVSVLSYYASWIILKTFVLKLIRKTTTDIDDELYDRKVFHKLVLLIPVVIIDSGISSIIETHSLPLLFVTRFIGTFYVIIFIGIIHTVLNVWNIVYSRKYTAGRSINSLIQAAKIVVTIIGMIIIISILFEVDTKAILTAIGTASAVMMLVFKDTILGFVSSIQLATNKMVLLGDWIEMSQYKADGIVVDISLVAVKVRNWDNTMTTIPTYALTTNSVTNWRSMSESGRRRIKRSVFMDMTSVKFVDKELMDKLRKVHNLVDYLNINEKELEEYSHHHTNLGIFRAYIVHYLKNHPQIDHASSTFLVRQLQPTDMGIPLEIYVFTNTSVWVDYEGIQADIFDHVLASVEYFDLHVYQRPSWNDYRTKELFSMKKESAE